MPTVSFDLLAASWMAQSAGAGIVKPVASSSWLITLIVYPRSVGASKRSYWANHAASRIPLVARHALLHEPAGRGIRVQREVARGHRGWRLAWEASVAFASGLRVGCARVTSDGAGGGNGAGDKAHAHGRCTSRVLSWREESNLCREAVHQHREGRRVHVNASRDGTEGEGRGQKKRGCQNEGEHCRGFRVLGTRVMEVVVESSCETVAACEVCCSL